MRSLPQLALIAFLATRELRLLRRNIAMRRMPMSLAIAVSSIDALAIAGMLGLGGFWAPLGWR
jgi:hypothetical protein